MAANEFPEVFSALKDVLLSCANNLDVVHDTDENFYLDTPFIQNNKKPMYFGSTIIKKNWVSFYLMPVYCFPELLDGISPALKKRMQGKSCFNFKVVDVALFKELKALTRACRQRFVEEGYIPV